MRLLINNLKYLVITFLLLQTSMVTAQELVRNTGIKKTVLKEGKGEMPKEGQEVKVKVEGKLEDGSIFDSGVMTFGIGDKDMIKGFNEVVPTMKAGEKAEVTIPASYGYGEKGVQEDGEYIIPPNATLIFEIQLIKVY